MTFFSFEEENSNLVRIHIKIYCYNNGLIRTQSLLCAYQVQCTYVDGILYHKLNSRRYSMPIKALTLITMLPMKVGQPSIVEK